MIKLLDILKEATSEDVKNEAFEWINRITLTSNTEFPSNSVLKFLKQYPIENNKIIYRGIGLIRSRIDNKYIKEINNLKIGDLLPDYLTRKTGISSYTKKKSLAKQYSEGAKSIIVESIMNKNNTIIDLGFFAKYIIKNNETFFDKEDLQYIKKDKEVLIQEPIKAKIIDIKGRL